MIRSKSWCMIGTRYIFLCYRVEKGFISIAWVCKDMLFAALANGVPRGCYRDTHLTVVFTWFIRGLGQKTHLSWLPFCAFHIKKRVQVIAIVIVPASWYVAMVKNSTMKIYGNPFGIQHVCNNFWTAYVAVAFFFFKGEGFCHLHDLSVDISGLLSERLLLIKVCIMQCSLLQSSLVVRKPWLWSGLLPSPSVHSCFPNRAYDPPCGQSGIWFSPLYRRRKGEIEEVK